ncbi:hypothetical protein ACWIG4_30405 [Streptomyces sp. NPDC002248]
MTSSHANCTHPHTKADRAKCRRDRAYAEKLRAEVEVKNRINHEIYIRPFEEQEALREEWETLSAKYARAFQTQAEQNADDTSVEEKFEVNSRRWYRIAIASLISARDDSTECFDLNDPEEGQYIKAEGKRWWIDHYRFLGNELSLTLVDEMGNRIIRNRSAL